MKTESFDFAIIGSGFGGSILSMILRRLGKSVLLLERGSHPRFVIGESSTPFANLLLEQIARRYDLPSLRALSEWGSWQQQFPELPVGLKRGFTFYHHSPGQPIDLENCATQLLVAASPNDRVADTHWYRPAFDQFLVEKAGELGVDFRDKVVISDVRNDSGIWTFVINPECRVTASFLIDATGPNGFAPLELPQTACPLMPSTAGVYAHFRNVPRLDEARNLDLPYPPDDAAVHHVFPGGWIWILRFNNGITSAGVAFAKGSSLDANIGPRARWESLLARFPTLHDLFQSAKAITPFYASPQLSFSRQRAADSNWALLPSTTGFVDPLLSTGFALNLLGITRLASMFERRIFDATAYEDQTFAEIFATADLISALYAKMSAPEEFSLLSLLYFAAMSFTETAWRLSKPHLASGFLLTNDTRFNACRADLCACARAGRKITRESIAAAIEPCDIAGLTNWERYPHYPVDLEDLRKNAAKLRADDASLNALFEKLGLAEKSPHSDGAKPIIQTAKIERVGWCG